MDWNHVYDMLVTPDYKGKSEKQAILDELKVRIERLENPILVGQVFEKAWGAKYPYPEQDLLVSINVGNWTGPDIVPTIAIDWNKHSEDLPPHHCVLEWNGDTWMPVGNCDTDLAGPDITNQPARPFVGFFPEEFRVALEVLEARR